MFRNIFAFLIDFSTKKLFIYTKDNGVFSLILHWFIDCFSIRFTYGGCR